MPKVREFLREAAGRYVAVDGRLWRTLFALAFRPGFLTREYLAGRRRRYVRPARLFLVLSVALFALIRLVSDAPVVRLGASDVAAGAAVDDNDSADASRKPTRENDVRLDIDLSPWSSKLDERLKRFRALSPSAKADQINAGALHYGPYAMLALLPASALLLQGLYVGGRRHPERPRRYAEHLVFAAHMHAFACLMTMALLVSRVPGTTYAATAWAVVYGAWALHGVYGGRWSGVIVRGALIALVYVILFGLAVAALVLVAALFR